MKEKRNLKRRHLIFYLRVIDTETELPIGYVVDITPEGIMLISEKEYKLGTQFKLRMDLPEDYLTTKHITFDAKVMWSQVDVNSDFFDIGLQFNELPEEDANMIQGLINLFGFQDIS